MKRRVGRAERGVLVAACVEWEVRRRGVERVVAIERRRAGMSSPLMLLDADVRFDGEGSDIVVVVGGCW